MPWADVGTTALLNVQALMQRVNELERRIEALEFWADDKDGGLVYEDEEG